MGDRKDKECASEKFKFENDIYYKANRDLMTIGTPATSFWQEDNLELLNEFETLRK